MMLEGIAPSGLARVRPRSLPPGGDPAALRTEVITRLDRSLGRRDLDDLGLVATVFRHRIASLDALRTASRPRRGRARPGDLLFLHAASGAPSVCVARRRLKRGVLEAACVTRGAVRRTRFDVRHPHTRRRGKYVVNTFLRPIRPGSGSREAFLAGALVANVRTLLP